MQDVLKTNLSVAGVLVAPAPPIRPVFGCHILLRNGPQGGFEMTIDGFLGYLARSQYDVNAARPADVSAGRWRGMIQWFLSRREFMDGLRL